MLATAIAEIRRSLLSARDLGDVMHVFFDKVESEPELFARSVPCAPDELLLQTIGVALRDVVEEEAVGLLFVAWMRIPEHGFVHGSFLMGKHPATLIYLEEPGIGLIGISMGGALMHYCRFRFAQEPARN